MVSIFLLQFFKKVCQNYTLKKLQFQIYKNESTETYTVPLYSQYLVRPGSSSSRRDVEVVDEKVLEGDHTVLEMVQTGVFIY